MENMAAVFSSNRNSSVEIKDVLTCVVCKNSESSNLKQFNCFHACHESCISSLIESAGPGSTVSCPECKTTCLIPKEGFPDELLHCKLKGISEIFGKTSPPCRMCQLVERDNVSTHFCITCHNYLCDGDTKRHQAMPDHKVIPNSELQNEQYLSQILTSKKAVCSKHTTVTATEVIKFYCEHCHLPACQDCCTTDHMGWPHKITAIQDASKILKEELQNKAREIQPQKEMCDSFKEKLEKLLNKVATNSKQQIEKCTNWEEEVKEAVDNIVNKKIKRIESMAQSQKNEIMQMEEEKGSRSKLFQSAQDYMEVFLKFGSESDFLQKHKTFIDNLNSCKKQKPSKVQITIKHSEIDLKDVKEIENDLKEMLKVYTVNERHLLSSTQLKSCDLVKKWETDGLKWGVAVDGEDVIAVYGKKIEVYGENGQKRDDIKYHGLVEACDIEVFNKQIFVSDVDEKKMDILVINRKGNFQRKISLPVKEHGMNGALGLAMDHTKGDLYIVSAGTNKVYKCPRGHLQSHPFITTGLDKPRYACVTPDHEIVVSNEGSHSVSKYSSEGTLVWVYGKKGAGEGELNGPEGVCVDPWGHVFVCDWGNQNIHQLSPEGTFLSNVNIEESIGRPLAITFDNQKMIVSTGGGSSQILVINCQYE